MRSKPTAPSLFRSWLLLAVVATILAAGSIALQSDSRALLDGRLPDELSVAGALSFRGETLWIDARPAADFANGHVPGSLPLNDQAWDAHLEAILTRWEPEMRVLVYCDDSACQKSRHVADLLRKDYQLDDVRVLKGGWEAWKKRQKAE